jgi:23S rRNA (pseudouridine1915-N3)-methyltransferase
MSKVRLLAVGTRMPAWVRDAYAEYVARLPPHLKLTLTEIDAAPRSAARSSAKAMQREGERLLAAIRKDAFVVALDERGAQLTTRELATWLAQRLSEPPDLTFLIGGADGLAPDVLARSNFRWSLSRLTFPHALVRVVLAEQLYRAHGVLTNHPYHRD